MPGNIDLGTITPGSNVDTTWPYALRFKEERGEKAIGGHITHQVINDEKVICAAFNDSHKICYDINDLDAMASFLVGKFMVTNRTNIYPFIFQLYRISDDTILNAWRVVINKNGHNHYHYTDYDGVRNVKSILKSLQVKYYE